MPEIQDELIQWYTNHQRELPWRNTRNPYHIWLSEIILQQTRVQQGLNYYLKFITNYPSISDLANASEQEILKDWQGLGYYSRARNLHATAKQIQHEHHGRFPEKYEEIIRLKGVGSYTSAAIASFAFGLHYAVLDGNVFRVLSRLFDIETAINSGEGKKIFSKLAQDLLPKNNSSTYNQAIMEFGALQCVPLQPDCLTCPLHHKCHAYKNKTVAQRPQKINKSKITERFFNYLVFKNSDEIIIQKREQNDIWKNMYEFPLLVRFSRDEHAETRVLKEVRSLFNVSVDEIFEMKKHILSHQHIYSRFIVFNTIPSNLHLKIGEFKKINLVDFHSYPIPKLIDNFMSAFETHTTKQKEF